MPSFLPRTRNRGRAHRSAQGARADRRRERAIARAHPSAWKPTTGSIAPWKRFCRTCACLPLSLHSWLVPLREYDRARRARDRGPDSVLFPAPPPPPSAPASRSAKPRTGRSTNTAATRCSSRWRAVEPTRTRRKRRPARCVSRRRNRGAVRTCWARLRRQTHSARRRSGRRTSRTCRPRFRRVPRTRARRARTSRPRGCSVLRVRRG